MIAIALDGATGDITATDHVLWCTNQRTPYVPSPLLYDGRLYFLSHYQGILSCLTGATGERAALPIRLNDIDDVLCLTGGRRRTGLHHRPQRTDRRASRTTLRSQNSPATSSTITSAPPPPSPARTCCCAGKASLLPAGSAQS